MQDPANLPFETEDVIDTIERLPRSRRADAAICPSDVAGALADDEGRWRAAMPQIRAVEARLVQEGRLRVTRRGAEVDAMPPGGRIRLSFPSGTDPR